jgi:hypothetical protein
MPGSLTHNNFSKHFGVIMSITVANIELGSADSESNIAQINTQSAATVVSWGSIFAGAAAAVAISLILLILGTGLGLSSVSPWANSGVTATTWGVTTIVWVTITQLVSSGLGGYLAGRLRTKLVALHTKEVQFRDTAHGFLSWAVATLLTAVLLTSVIGSIISGGVKAGASVVGGIANTATVATATGAASAGSDKEKSGADGGPMSYFVDSLFRKDSNAAGANVESGSNSSSPTTEVVRIFMNAVQSGSLSPEDVKYAGSLVSQRTGLPQADAEKRVNDTYATVQEKMRAAEVATKDAADKGRKATAYGALWFFITLLGGAIFASFAAKLGGGQRDHQS